MAINTAALQATLSLLEALPSDTHIVVGTPLSIYPPDLDLSGLYADGNVCRNTSNEPWRRENKRKGMSQSKRRKQARRK